MAGTGAERSVHLWADRLRRDRLARHYTIPDAVRLLRIFATPVALPDDESLRRTWTRWESGQIEMPDEIYRRAIAAMFQSVPAAYFPAPDAADTFARLTEDQTAELIQRLRHSTVDQAAMDALHTTVDQLCTDYASRPAPIVLADAQTWLEKVNGLLDKRITLAQHRDTLTMAGWLTLLVACLYYDTGGDRAAAAAERSALELADEVGNMEIAAWTAEIRAWMALTAGDNYGAVAAAREGLERTSTHSASVQLQAQAARAWARIGDREEAFTHMRAGRELLARLSYPENPRNHFQVDPAKWDFYAMDIWRLIGEDALAGEAAETVIRTSTRARRAVHFADAAVGGKTDPCSGSRPRWRRRRGYRVGRQCAGYRPSLSAVTAADRARCRRRTSAGPARRRVRGRPARPHPAIDDSRT